MIEVKLLFDQLLLFSSSTEFMEVFNARITDIVRTHTLPSVSEYKHPVCFHLKVQNTWFVGTILVRRVLENYYIGLLKGSLYGGTAKDFLIMEKKSKNYSHDNGLFSRRLDEYLYETPSSKLPSFMLIEVDSNE